METAISDRGGDRQKCGAMGTTVQSIITAPLKRNLKPLDWRSVVRREGQPPDRIRRAQKS
jgi:hypothetical protein